MPKIPTVWLSRMVREQPVGIVGAFIVVMLVLTAVFAPLLAPYGPKEAAFRSYKLRGSGLSSQQVRVSGE